MRCGRQDVLQGHVPSVLRPCRIPPPRQGHGQGVQALLQALPDPAPRHVLRLLPALASGARRGQAVRLVRQGQVVGVQGHVPCMLHAFASQGHVRLVPARARHQGPRVVRLLLPKGPAPAALRDQGIKRGMSS